MGVPVNPRCVKPWIVPNQDPGHGSGPFVTATVGTITNPGTFTGNNGVIGETFNLTADCDPGTGTGAIFSRQTPVLWRCLRVRSNTSPERHRAPQ